MRRRAAVVAAAGVAAALAGAAPAHGHGLVQRANLPIPEWLFGWAAAVVLVVSFVALGVLRPRPRLEEDRWRPLPGGRLLGSTGVEAVCGAIGVALLVLVVAAGLAGIDSPTDNLAPIFVFIVFWVGLAFASALLGDLFSAFSPWRALGRALRLRGTRPYPERAGRWPAAAGLLAFTWLELASGLSDDPRPIGALALAYTLVTLAMQWRYGTEAWSRHGETFRVYFGLFAALSPFERRDGVVGVRRPLSGLTRLPVVPGAVAVVLVAIGTVTFDGLSQGRLWRDGPETWLDGAEVLAGTLGLLFCVGIVAGFYALGMRGVATVGGGRTPRELSGAFVHSLVPIAFVYVAAHYLTYLLFEGQAIGYLASDPLGEGWNLLGTADRGIDFGLLSQETAWYLQVGSVVLGHVAALVLAHDRALRLFRAPKLAATSQRWMLVVMVGFTSLALYLLAAAGA